MTPSSQFFSKDQFARVLVNTSELPEGQLLDIPQQILEIWSGYDQVIDSIQSKVVDQIGAERVVTISVVDGQIQFPPFTRLLADYNLKFRGAGLLVTILDAIETTAEEFGIPYTINTLLPLLSRIGIMSSAEHEYKVVIFSS